MRQTNRHYFINLRELISGKKSRLFISKLCQDIQIHTGIFVAMNYTERSFFQNKKSLTSFSPSGFSQTHNTGNNANIDIRHYVKTKKSSDKMLPLVGIEPGTLMNL